MRHVVTILFLSLLFVISAAHAQFSEGQPIEYNGSGKWEPATFLRLTPDGSQAIIREKPSQFFPEGFQRTVDLKTIRPRTQAAAPPPAPPPVVVPADDGPVALGGGGLMTKEEVLGYLRQNIGSDSTQWSTRGRDRHLALLAEEIKRRGANFRYSAIDPFGQEALKNGMMTPVSFAIEDNFGPPAQQSYFFGKWDLWKVGAPTHFTRGNYLYKRMEYSGLSGTLTIRSDGTYSWNANTPVSGRWRPATKAEMDTIYKGGAGIVLLNSKSGWDWVVVKNYFDGQKGDDIVIRYMGMREFGSRGR